MDYDSIASGYNELYGEEQSKKLALIKESIKINKNAKLLDVGCGSGLSSDFGCFTIGIDPSISLLNQNKDKVKFCATAENLPFMDNSFDFVVSVTAMHNFYDIEKAVLEIKRVGRNNFVFSILKKSSKFGPIKRLIEKNFKIDRMTEEEKDVVFFCNA